MGEIRNLYKILVGKYEKKRDRSEDLGVDGNIKLKQNLRKWGWRVWIGFVWLMIGIGGGLL
jgi:hypothetical protein